MPYIVTIDEALKTTVHQEGLVRRRLQNGASSPVTCQPPLQDYGADTRFHGTFTVRYPTLEAATAALKEVGKLKLGLWDQCWQLQDADTGEVIILPEDVIAMIDRPREPKTMPGGDTAKGKVSIHQLWDLLLERQDYQCYVCGLDWTEQVRRYGQSFDKHRIHPGRQSGAYTPENTIMVCRPCHGQIDGWTIEQVDALRAKRRKVE
jgi:hypothetical protein